ncbi:MAG: hypothetical protein RL630_255 [Verrucomicrobiota bacterium]|jgi:hypothetical protein
MTPGHDLIAYFKFRRVLRSMKTTEKTVSLLRNAPVFTPRRRAFMLDL